MTCPHCQSDRVVHRAAPTTLIITLLTLAGFIYLLVIAFSAMRGGDDSSAFTGTFYLLAGTLGVLWNLLLLRRWLRQRSRPYFCRQCGHEWA